MKISEVLPKGCISEVYFRYNSQLEVYTNLGSDITKLAEIAMLKKEEAYDRKRH